MSTIFWPGTGKAALFPIVLNCALLSVPLVIFIIIYIINIIVIFMIIYNNIIEPHT